MSTIFLVRDTQIFEVSVKIISKIKYNLTKIFCFTYLIGIIAQTNERILTTHVSLCSTTNNFIFIVYFFWSMWFSEKNDIWRKIKWAFLKIICMYMYLKQKASCVCVYVLFVLSIKQHFLTVVKWRRHCSSSTHHHSPHTYTPPLPFVYILSYIYVHIYILFFIHTA